MTKERLNYIKTHTRFLQRRKEITIHPLDREAVWQMYEDLGRIQNGEMELLGIGICELILLRHNLEELLTWNVKEEDC